MHLPSITAIYLAVLALLYAALALQVARLRQRDRRLSATTEASSFAARSASTPTLPNMCRSSR